MKTRMLYAEIIIDTEDDYDLHDIAGYLERMKGVSEATAYPDLSSLIMDYCEKPDLFAFIDDGKWPPVGGSMPVKEITPSIPTS